MVSTAFKRIFSKEMASEFQKKGIQNARAAGAVAGNVAKTVGSKALRNTVIAAGAAGVASKTILNNTKNSIQSNSVPIKKRVSSILITTMTFLLIGFLAVSNYSSLSFVFESFVSIFFPLMGVPIGGMYGLDSQMFNTYYLILFVFSVYVIIKMRDKIQVEAEIVFLLLFLPVIFYYIIELSVRYFAPQINDLLLFTLPWVLGFLFFYFMFFIGFLERDEIQERFGKSVEVILLLFCSLGVVLFLLGGSLQAAIVTDQINQVTDEAGNSANSFSRYYKCEVLGGNLRGLPECVEVREEVIVRKDTSEVFRIKYRSESSSNVVHEGSRNVRFVFDFDVPSNVNVRLLNYTCFVDNRRIDSIQDYAIPAQYSQLTTSVPDKATIALDCPVYDIVDSTRDETFVRLRLDFFVEDKITQFIPFVDCSDSFFIENPDIACERVGEEYFNGNINDPRVETFLQTVDDEVLGAYSVDAKVSGLRGNLPLYLNSNSPFILTNFDYSIEFQEKNGHEIKEVQIKNIQPPGFIQLSDSIETNYSAFDDEGIIRIDFSTTNFNSNFIGNSLPMVIDYEVFHNYESPRTKVFIRRPEVIPEETDSEITSGADGEDTIIGGGDDVLEEEAVDESIEEPEGINVTP